MVEKNVVGTYNRKDFYPEFGYEAQDQESIPPVEGTSAVSVAPVSRLGTQIDPIEQWRSFSEQLRARRLARQQAEQQRNQQPDAQPPAEQQAPAQNPQSTPSFNDQQYQSVYEHDQLNIHPHADPMMLNLQRYLTRVNDALPNEHILAYEPDQQAQLQAATEPQAEALSTQQDPELEPGALRVSDVMTRKVVCVLESTTIEQVASICNRRGFSGVPVVNEFQGLIGIVTLSDIMQQLLANNSLSTYVEQGGQILEQKALAILDDPVRKYMRHQVFTVSPQTTVKEACQLMYQQGIRRVIVAHGDIIKGVFSAQDAVRILANADLHLKAE